MAAKNPICPGADPPRWHGAWMLTHLVTGCLVVAACGGKPHRSGTGGKHDGPWQTQSWPMTRGGTTDGALDDPVPRNPVVEWTFQADCAVTTEVTVAEGLMVFGDENGGIHAVDMRERRQRWLVKAGDAVEASPAIAGGRVFAGANDRWFRALDARDGRELWKVRGGEKFPTGAVLLPGGSAGGDRLLVNCYDGVTHCLAAADGKTIWQHVTDDYINGSPVPVDGGLLVFGGCDAVLHGLSIGDGKALHTHRVDAQVIRSVASRQGTVFAVSHASQLVAVDLRRGKTLWTRENGDHPFLTTPAVDGTRVYAGSRDRHLHAFDRTTGESAWKFRTGGRVEGSPLVFKDAVVFGSADGRLYAVDPASGVEIWRLDLGQALACAPAFAAGEIMIGGADGTVFVIRGGGGGGDQ